MKMIFIDENIERLSSTDSHFQLSLLLSLHREERKRFLGELYMMSETTHVFDGRPTQISTYAEWQIFGVSNLNTLIHNTIDGKKR